MNHDLIICPRCGRDVSPSPAGDGLPVPHYVMDTTRACGPCACPLPQPGWSSGCCSTCGGEVSASVYRAGYPGTPSIPKSEGEIAAAVALARTRQA